MNELQKNKNIVLIYLGRKGGGSIYSYEMAKALIDKGVSLTVFISSYVDNLDKWKELKCNRCEIIKTYRTKLGFVLKTIFFKFIYIKRIKKKYSNLNPDACYVPMSHFWDTYIFSIFKTSKKIVTIHDPVFHSTNKKLFWYLTKKIEEHNSKKTKIDDYIVLTKQFVPIVSQNKGVPKENVHVIPHGIFNYYEDFAGVKHNYPKNYKTNFLFFGRIDKYKGVDILLKAFKIIEQNNVDCFLTIVGSGDIKPYSSLISQLNNIEIINRWVKIEEVSSFFQPESNVIVVLPYIDATQSGVIPIAQNFLVPVIATEVGGLPEQIENNITGYLVEPNNPEALARTMIDVSKGNYDSVVKNAKQYIESLSWSNLSQELIKVIYR